MDSNMCEWINDWFRLPRVAPLKSFRKIKCRDFVFTLYLEWRNPWQFYNVLGDMGNKDYEFITYIDVFTEYGLYFKDIEYYRSAKSKAEKIFFEVIPLIVENIYNMAFDKLLLKLGVSDAIYFFRFEYHKMRFEKILKQIETYITYKFFREDRDFERKAIEDILMNITNMASNFGAFTTILRSKCDFRKEEE